MFIIGVDFKVGVYLIAVNIIVVYIVDVNIYGVYFIYGV